MLIPPEVDLKDALAPVCKDLIKLQKGVTLKEFKDNRCIDIEVKGGISCIIADHPQACDLSRHLGVNANQNCRLCWSDKFDRSNFSTSILHHENTRRRTQTDVIVAQTKELLETKYSINRQRELQKMSGIRATQCPLQGVDVDPHIQCFPDIDHLLDLGLTKVLFDYINSTLSVKQLDDIKLRYESLSLPAGWSRINLNLKSGSKKMKPMTFMRKLAILGCFLYKDLIDKKLQKLLVDLLKLRGQILAPFQTNASIQEV
jgi:hypothetical protein